MIIKHSKHSFMLIMVLVLLSLAAIAELLATRYLVDLCRHVQQRHQIVQHRVNPSKPLAKPHIPPSNLFHP